MTKSAARKATIAPTLVIMIPVSILLNIGHLQ